MGSRALACVLLFVTRKAADSPAFRVFFVRTPGPAMAAAVPGTGLLPRQAEVGLLPNALGVQGIL